MEDLTVDRDPIAKVVPKELTEDEERLVKYLDRLVAPLRRDDKPKDQVAEIQYVLAESTLDTEHKVTLAALCSAILGFKIEYTNDGTKMCKGMVMVPTRAGGGHDYTLDEPIMLRNISDTSASGFKLNGPLGNTIPKSCLRPATRDEIVRVLRAFGKDIICKELGIVII